MRRSGPAGEASPRSGPSLLEDDLVQGGRRPRREAVASLEVSFDLEYKMDSFLYLRKTRRPIHKTRDHPVAAFVVEADIAQNVRVTSGSLPNRFYNRNGNGNRNRNGYTIFFNIRRFGFGLKLKLLGQTQTQTEIFLRF